MKNLLVIALLFNLVRVNTCLTQDTDFNKPLVHASKESYAVNEFAYDHHKTVNNTNNYLYKKILKYPEHAVHPELRDKQYDRSLVAKIFYDTFPGSRLKKLADENLDLLIDFDSDLQGNVLEVSFVFKNNISFTPIELEKLEIRLKKEVKFTLNDKVFKGYDYVPITTFVNFKRLINHTADAVR